MATPRLFVKNKQRNTVLNWHKEPEEEFDLYGEAFWNAAKTLLQNERPSLHLTQASSFIYTVTHSNCS
jgi:hypothetical protein